MISALLKSNIGDNCSAYSNVMDYQEEHFPKRKMTNELIEFLLKISEKLNDIYFNVESMFENNDLKGKEDK